MKSTNVLELKNLQKQYGKVQALRRVDLCLGHGIHALLGPNGSGKTTLMNILAGLLKPHAGEVLYRGKRIDKWGEDYRARLGYMPQYPALYPTFTVMEMMLYVAELKGLPRDSDRQIESLLARVELSDVFDRRISALSGGMKQRLSLCTAVLGDPEILILDEPTAGLDPRQRVVLRDFISEIGQDRTVLWATHIVSDVESIAHNIIFMKKGEATLMPREKCESLESTYLSFFGDVL